MKRYIALLRGINVGGNKKVEMTRLKACFEDMGYSNVVTYINSGNIIFDSEVDNFSQIEMYLERIFGFKISVVFRSAENITNLIEKIPVEWENNTEQKTDILFLWEDYDNEKSVNLIKNNKGVDNILYIEGAIVWHIFKNQYNTSGMNQFIKSTLYKNMTARNINTVRKLVQLVQ